MTQTFSPPVDRIPFAPPLERWRHDRGRTVYRKDDVWTETVNPYWDDIKDADLVDTADRPGGEKTDGTDKDRLLFLGGRTYTVSDAVATLLTAAGYSAYLT